MNPSEPQDDERGADLPEAYTPRVPGTQMYL